MKKIIGKFFCLLTILIFISGSVITFLSQFEHKKTKSIVKEIHFNQKSDNNSLFFTENEETEEVDTEDNVDDHQKLITFTETSTLYYSLLSTIIDDYFENKTIVFSHKKFKPSEQRWKKHSQFII